MKTETAKTLQTEVQEYLKENGIKKTYFANLLDVSPAMLSHWFAGRVIFNKQKLDTIIDMLEKH